MQKAGEYLEQMSTRLRRVAVLIGLLFVAVLIGYWYLQIVQASHYRRLSENNRLREAAMRAPRGLITDRSGVRLVENIPSYNLLVDRSLSEDLASSLGFAARLLEREPDELTAVLERYQSTPRFVPVLIAEDLTLAQVARFEVASLEHPEFLIDVLQRRLYRHGAHTAHLLGYLGEADDRDIEGSSGDLRAGDLVGQEGVEQAYDERLRGRDGERVLVVDSRGRTIEQFTRQAAQPGEALQLTIDLELQQEAQHLMAGKVGAVVAIDPRDGAVRALLSAPSFDPNLFARRLQRRQWNELLEQPNNPLQNRAIHNTYAPGSVFKIVLALAGLSEELIDPDDRVYCRGSTRLYNRTRRCHKASGHGWMDLQDAVRESCDVYFYVKGQDLGIETIARYSRRLGLGSVSGIDVGGERAGLVPDSAWSRRARNTRWYPGETISVAIGQGPLLTTPMQVAVMYAAVANGGYKVTPHVIEGGASEPRDLELEPTVLAHVQRALEAVVNDRGTGAVARLSSILVAGKTGTAQVIEQKNWIRSDDLPYKQRDHAWFASYAPADNPELVIVVFVEHGGHGSRAAAPVAKALYERYFRSHAARAS